MKRERVFNEAAHELVCSEADLRIQEWLDGRSRRQRQVERDPGLNVQLTVEVYGVLRRNYLVGQGVAISDTQLARCFRRAKTLSHETFDLVPSTVLVHA